MRKSLLIVVAVMFVVAISSCKKTYVTPNNNITVVAEDVRPNSWVFSDEEAYVNDILVPDLNDYYNNVGAVLVYLSFSKGVYEQIPYVYNGISYSFIHSNGKVTLYAQTVDGLAIQPNQTMDVKVVLIDSNDPGR